VNRISTTIVPRLLCGTSRDNGCRPRDVEGILDEARAVLAREEKGGAEI